MARIMTTDREGWCSGGCHSECVSDWSSAWGSRAEAVQQLGAIGRQPSVQLEQLVRSAGQLGAVNSVAPESTDSATASDVTAMHRHLRICRIEGVVPLAALVALQKDSAPNAACRAGPVTVLGLSPYLSYPDAAAGIEWLQRTFGWGPVKRYPAEGPVAEAEPTVAPGIAVHLNDLSI